MENRGDRSAHPDFDYVVANMDMQAQINEPQVRRLDSFFSLAGRQIRLLWNRPLFRGYHIAFATMFALIGGMIVAAFVLGRAFFGISFDEVFVFGFGAHSLAAWLLMPLLWIGLATLTMVRRQSERPTRLLLRWMRFRADWLIRGFLIILAYPTMSKSFSIIKTAIPNVVNYWADPLLIKLDQAIIGTDAWVLTHGFFPPWFLIAIDRVYLVWFTYLALMTGVYSFTRDIRLQIRSALTFFLCWILLGIFAAYAFASVGPVFFDRIYADDHFPGLSAVLGKAHSETGLIAVYIMGHLYELKGTPEIGGGMSAMPSMHVSMAYLGFLMAMQFHRQLWLKIFTFTFTALIIVGSVHLGWHYLSDGLISILGTYLIWRFVERFVNWSYRATPTLQR